MDKGGAARRYPSEDAVRVAVLSGVSYGPNGSPV